MSDPPALKRRRLDDALHKPFKSPLRTPLKSNPNPPAATPLRTTTTASTPILKNEAKPTPESQPKHPRPNPTSRPHNYTPSPRQLESAILHARRDIDSLKQARTILTSHRTAELELLVVKWRDAARLAAEEVFASARDKVNAMGGVGALRERERERVERRREWEEEDRRAEGEKRVREMRAMAEEAGVEWREGEGEDCEGGERDAKQEEEYEGGKRGGTEKDSGRDDDGFTIGMMLTSMNIDLDLIGYSAERQMWMG